METQPYRSWVHHHIDSLQGQINRLEQGILKLQDQLAAVRGLSIPIDTSSLIESYENAIVAQRKSILRIQRLKLLAEDQSKRIQQRST